MDREKLHHSLEVELDQPQTSAALEELDRIEALRGAIDDAPEGGIVRSRLEAKLEKAEQRIDDAADRLLSLYNQEVDEPLTAEQIFTKEQELLETEKAHLDKHKDNLAELLGGEELEGLHNTLALQENIVTVFGKLSRTLGHVAVTEADPTKSKTETEPEEIKPEESEAVQTPEATEPKKHVVTVTLKGNTFTNSRRLDERTFKKISGSSESKQAHIRKQLLRAISESESGELSLTTLRNTVAERLAGEDIEVTSSDMRVAYGFIEDGIRGPHNAQVFERRGKTAARVLALKDDYGFKLRELSEDGEPDTSRTKDQHSSSVEPVAEPELPASQEVDQAPTTLDPIGIYATLLFASDKETSQKPNDIGLSDEMVRYVTGGEIKSLEDLAVKIRELDGEDGNISNFIKQNQSKDTKDFYDAYIEQIEQVLQFANAVDANPDRDLLEHNLRAAEETDDPAQYFYFLLLELRNGDSLISKLEALRDQDSEGIKYMIRRTGSPFTSGQIVEIEPTDDDSDIETDDKSSTTDAKSTQTISEAAPAKEDMPTKPAARIAKIAKIAKMPVEEIKTAVDTITNAITAAGVTSPEDEVNPMQIVSLLSSSSFIKALIDARHAGLISGDDRGPISAHQALTAWLANTVTINRFKAGKNQRKLETLIKEQVAIMFEQN